MPEYDAEQEESDLRVLEKRPLHYAMVLLNFPSRWPGWIVWLLSVGLAAAAAAGWRFALGSQRDVLLVGVTQWVFMAVDAVVLLILPLKNISFGPWKPIFFTLALPRLAATALSALVGSWLGRDWGLALFLVVQLVGTISLIWGTFIEPFRLRLTEYQVTSDRLPPGTPPIRLLHISDLHVERLTRRESMLLSLVEQSSPDLILITGDYVNLSYNRDPKAYSQVRQLLSQLSAPGGVYATLGSPPADVREEVVPALRDLPLSLMREDWTRVDLGAGRKLVLMGMDCTHHLAKDGARLERLVDAAPNSVPQVLLYHSPELMPQAAEHGIDFYLCGHTHGGQVRLPVIGPLLTSSQLGRKYVMGWYQSGRTRLFVSRGVGLEGLSAPRVRFLAPPEITLITLKPEA